MHRGLGKFVIAGGLCMVAGAEIAGAAPCGGAGTLRLPENALVAFYGDVDYDKAGLSEAGILYPAPSALGLLAGIMTHGIVESKMKSAQKQHMRDEADKVLVPYRDYLRQYEYRDLMARGLAAMSMADFKLMAHRDKSGNGAIIDTTPVYFFSQDARTLMLLNTFEIVDPAATATMPEKTTVKIVAAARTEPDMQAYWLANDAGALADISANMFGESVRLAIADHCGKFTDRTSPYRTVRYAVGGAVRMERAQVLEESAERILMRTLRGWLMSVPVRQAEPPDP